MNRRKKFFSGGYKGERALPLKNNRDINKKIEKKMRILNTAFALFQQNTVGATAIDDIVKSAGIARGTFYLYFKDKSDLLEQIILYKSTECMRTMMKNVLARTKEEQLSFPELARVILNEYINFLIDHRDVLMVLTKNISSCLRGLPEFYDKEIEYYYGILIEKMKEYGFEESRAHKTVFIVSDMIGSICSDAIMVGKPFGINEIRDSVIDAALLILRNGDERYKELG